MLHPFNKKLASVLITSTLLCACSTSPDKAGTGKSSAFSRSAEPARLLMQDGQMQEAIPVLMALTGDYPELATPYINLSIAHRSNGDTASARQAIDEALKRDPESATAMHQSGILYREQGSFAAAEKAYLDALTTDPDYALVHRNLGILYDLYMQRPDKALPHYQRYLKLNTGEDKEVSLWVADIQQRHPSSQAKASP